jgi:hypothetical protein
MVPTRTLPIVGNTTPSTASRQITADARPRSILKRLASSLTARRPVPDRRHNADLIRMDRNLALIEHETCDCL